MKMTPAQRALLKQLEKAQPAGLPLDIVHKATLDGLTRRGLVETVETTRVQRLHMVRLVDHDVMGGDVA